MEQKQKPAKMTYDEALEMVEKLENDYKAFRNELASQLNTKQINRLTYQNYLLDYENRLFYCRWIVWKFEMRQAIRDADKSLQDFVELDGATLLISDINDTSRRKKKVNYRYSEVKNKVYRVDAAGNWDVLKRLAKSLPEHRIDRKRFPVPQNDK